MAFIISKQHSLAPCTSANQRATLHHGVSSIGIVQKKQSLSGGFQRVSVRQYVLHRCTQEAYCGTNKLICNTSW